MSDKDADSDLPLTDVARRLGLSGLAATLIACDEETEEPDPIYDGPGGSFQSTNPDESGFGFESSGNPDTNSDQVGGDDSISATNPGGQQIQQAQRISTVDQNGDVDTQVNGPLRFSALVPGPNNRIAISASNVTGVTQTMSDGNAIPVWSFLSSSTSGFNNDRVMPAPCIEVLQGSTVQLELSSMMPHTVHLHGLDVNQANDGTPATSGYVAAMSMPSPAVAGQARLPSPFTYVFNATHAGTYMYHCHVDTALHMEMGMSGTLIVRPPDGSLNRLWVNGPVYDREFIWHLHTFDSRWHQFTGTGIGTARYRPDYFMINGRDGLSLMNDPVSALHGAANETVLIRAVNPGFLPARLKLAGLRFRIVSSDGRPLARQQEVSEFVIAPGERYDILFTMPAQINDLAGVEYLNIMGTGVLGTAQTGINTL